MKKTNVLLLLVLACLIALMGCGKEAVSTEESQIQETSVPSTEKEEIQIPTMNWKPGTLGVYVLANAEIETGSDVLDKVTMTMPENVTRQPVSALQHDFIMNEMQVGGILLLDIPNEMLKTAAETYEGTQELASYLANQIMPDADPSKITFSGGGKSRLYDCYIFLTYYDFNTNYAYTHHIYIGESCCYDVWFDDVWHPDGGNLILSTLSSENIKPEWNDAEFGWAFENGELITK